MVLVIVRHGQTQWNNARIFRGRRNVPLNKSGEREALSIANRLSETKLDAVVSSPLSRASQTAHAIALAQSKPVQTSEALTDIDFGAWEGLSLVEAQRRFPREYEVWKRRPDMANIPGAETLADVRARLGTVLNDVYEESGNASVAFVTHGSIIKILLCMFLGVDNSCFWRIKQDNAAINVVAYRKETSKLFLVNDTSHVSTIQRVVEAAGGPDPYQEPVI